MAPAIKIEQLGEYRDVKRSGFDPDYDGLASAP